MRTRDHVDRYDFADYGGRSGARVGGGFDRADITAHHYGDEA
jgi:hypothetical protein